MDNEKNSVQPQDDEQWLDEILSQPEVGEEIVPDEHAIHAAGLIHPSDAEVERIMQEALTEGFDQPEEEPAAEQPQEEPFRDEEYRDAFGEGDALNAVFDDNQPTVPAAADDRDPEPDVPEAPMRKRRPKHKKGYGLLGIPHILVTFVWIAIVLAIGITLGRMLWVSVADVLAFGREDQVISITITEEDTIDTVTEKLHSAGLIRYPTLFKAYADLSHAEEKISVGTFTLNTVYDYHALVNSLRTYSNSREVVEIMIPEGYSCRQIFQLLEEEGVCEAARLEQYAAEGELNDYWFLENVERGDRYCLEGFLFPDTYKFYLQDDPKRVLHKFLDNFKYRYTDLMAERLIALNENLSEVMARNGHDEDYIASHQLDIRDVVIIASLIEKESANNLESYAISSVIYNRLYRWGDTPAFLNIDASLIYGLDGNIDPATGKTKPLTESDLAKDGPYNTYTRMGLPAGPIANPGLNSLNAALVPDESDYFYYALNPATNEHHFSKTMSEHEKFLSSLED